MHPSIHTHMHRFYAYTVYKYGLCTRVRTHVCLPSRGKHSGRDAPKMFQTLQKMAGSIVVWVSLGRTESHQHKEEGNVHWCRENAGDSPE